MTSTPDELLKLIEQMKTATSIDIENLIGNIASKSEKKEIKVEAKEVDKK